MKKTMGGLENGHWLQSVIQPFGYVPVNIEGKHIDIMPSYFSNPAYEELIQSSSQVDGRNTATSGEDESHGFAAILTLLQSAEQEMIRMNHAHAADVSQSEEPSHDDERNHVFDLKQLVKPAFQSETYKKPEENSVDGYDYDFHEILDLIENAFYKPTAANKEIEQPEITQSREEAFGQMRSNLQKYLNKLLQDEESIDNVEKEKSLETLEAMRDHLQGMKN